MRRVRPTVEDRTDLPLVAVVGRTNVGKSTLYNRLVGGRLAIVEDRPSVTRDRRFGVVEWLSKQFRVVDTGGLEPDAKKGIEVGITRQARAAIEAAELVLFILDAQTGPTPTDRQIARDLHKLGKKILWVANKVDDRKHQAELGPFYELGADEVFGISAEHGRGVTDLIERVLELLPDAGIEPEAGVDPIRLAFVGKPNAGKSSMVNAVLGEDRVLVDEVPGTTMDPVDTPFVYEGQRWVLVDTAGIRKHRSTFGSTEAIAVTLAKRQIERADVVVLVIDAKQGATEQDARIASLAEENGCAVVIALNKVDQLRKREIEDAIQKVREELAFLAWARIVPVSALEGIRVDLLLEAARDAVGQHRSRVPTAELNRLFEGVIARSPPPSWRGQTIKLYYVTQASIRPPTFVVQTNKPEGVSTSYRRYLNKELRGLFGLEGTPIRLVVRGRSKPGE